VPVTQNVEFKLDSLDVVVAPWWLHHKLFAGFVRISIFIYMHVFLCVYCVGPGIFLSSTLLN
jgi:hypothetical protein